MEITGERTPEVDRALGAIGASWRWSGGLQGADGPLEPHRHHSYLIETDSASDALRLARRVLAPLSGPLGSLEVRRAMIAQ